MYTLQSDTFMLLGIMSFPRVCEILILGGLLYAIKNQFVWSALFHRMSFSYPIVNEMVGKEVFSVL